MADEAPVAAPAAVEGPAPSLVEQGGATPAPALVPDPAPAVSAEPTSLPVAATQAEGEAAPPAEPAPSLPAEAPSGSAEPSPQPSPAPAAEAPPVVAGAEAADPQPEAPAEPKPAEAAPAEAAPAVVEPPAPIVYNFVLPENVTPADAEMGEFTQLLGDSRVAPEAGQSLLDLHGRIMQQAVAAEEQRQRDVFDQTRANWRKDVATAFGNQYDTRLNDARWAVMQLVPNEVARKELWSVLSFTGAGDHPSVVRFLADTAAKLRERPAPPPPAPHRPIPANPWDARYSRGNGGLVER